MRQAGRYLPIYQTFARQIPDFWERCFQPDISSEISTFPIQEYDLDAVIFFSDILIIPKVLGQDIQFIKGKGIAIDPVNIDDLLDSFSANKFHKDLFPVYQGLTLTRLKTPEETPILGFVGAPWTLLHYILGANNEDRSTYVQMFAKQHPEKVATWIEKLTTIVAQHLINQLSTGAEAAQVFESHAAGVPAELREEFLVNPWRKIAQQARKAFSEKPLILFPRGYEDPLSTLNTLVDDYAAISIPENFDLKEAHEILDSRFVFQGGPPPEVLKKGGNMLKKQLTEFKETLGSRPYIANLSHGIVPETPIQHVHDYINFVRETNSSSKTVSNEK